MQSAREECFGRGTTRAKALRDMTTVSQRSFAGLHSTGLQALDLKKKPGISDRDINSLMDGGAYMF